MRLKHTKWMFWFKKSIVIASLVRTYKTHSRNEAVVILFDILIKQHSSIISSAILRDDGTASFSKKVVFRLQKTGALTTKK
jgi:hypothetical protein